jgi:hypothetical protein
MIHDWWRVWWREKIFSLPGEAPPKLVVARPWWRRVKELSSTLNIMFTWLQRTWQTPMNQNMHLI